LVQRNDAEAETLITFAKPPFSTLMPGASAVEKENLMTARVLVSDILTDASGRRALRGRRRRTAPNSNALTEGVGRLFEALRATDYFDERILRAHERLPMPERAQMARAYFHVLPPYEQFVIYRAASQSPGSPHHQ
jgi:hypothetical protein